MVGIGGGFEVVGDADSRELQIFAFLLAVELFRRFGVVAVMALGGLAGFDLRFYVFAFPSSRHAYSLTHFAAGGVFMKEKVCGSG